MDRELLLEIGCEELPAGWLPGLTNQIGEIVDAQLRAHRLPPESPVETYSTPRRLTVCVLRIPERQSDLEELVNGPPVSAGFKPDGSPTPAAAGFAAKQGVEVGALERIQTPKGEYLAFRKRQRGKATVDVLPDVLRDSLRSLTFPKAMHWDAMLDDGRGELVFGRPIRWMLYLYGGRVVPFSITRTLAAQTSQVQDVSTGAVTYGHRFLTTSGRAGRAIKVRSFDEYRARLLENFVILERAERHNKIARELDAKAQRLQGRVSRTVSHETGLLLEVPDLVEYPSVVAGTFALEFLELPEEVLTTTLIHHQHYFPVEGEDGKLKNAFLAVINTEPDNERTIARNAERVVTARLRDARFFWEADRKIPLESRIDRLGTLLFHKKAGTYKEKAERIAHIAEDTVRISFFGGNPDNGGLSELARQAGRLAKTDLTTDMVREFTELQGVIGGIYAREEGLPEEVWKAIYFHYLPLGIEADAPPFRKQLGTAAVTWAAVSIADKLDTLISLFSAGERPTGSRDPYGLRRAAHGVLRILIDLPELTGLTARPTITELMTRVQPLYTACDAAVMQDLIDFMNERLVSVFEQRGYDRRHVRAVILDRHAPVRPLDERHKLEVLPEFTKTAEFQGLAIAFKRVRNLAKQLSIADFVHEESFGPPLSDLLVAPAEKALLNEIKQREPLIEKSALDGVGFGEALGEASRFGPAVDKFFDDVLVMTDDSQLRMARLRLLRGLEVLILKLADISQIVAEEKQA
jgi:glycyl-tRNA synthetase beta chain